MIRPRFRLAALLLLAAAAAAGASAHERSQGTHAQDPQTGLAPIPERVALPLDASALAGLERHAVSARVHRATLHCEGVALFDLVRASGTIPDGALRSRHLSRYLLVLARDGYRVSFSLAELDPGTGGRAAYVVDRCDGAALDERDGPLRLLVPDDARAARSVRQLQSIEVIAPP